MDCIRMVGYHDNNHFSIDVANIDIIPYSKKVRHFVQIRQGRIRKKEKVNICWSIIHRLIILGYCIYLYGVVVIQDHWVRQVRMDVPSNYIQAAEVVINFNYVDGMAT